VLSRRPYGYVIGAAFCAYASLGSIVYLLPQVVHARLHGRGLAVGVIVGASAVAAIVARPIDGKFADRAGPRSIAATGAAVIGLGALPMFSPHYAAVLSARLAAGLGEGMVMSSSVLWLLWISGQERRGRALGHAGLALYAGLIVGPILAELLGGLEHAGRVFALAVAMPLCAGGLFAAVPARRTSSSVSERRVRPVGLARSIARPGAGLFLANVGYVALVGFGAEAVHAWGSELLPVYGLSVIGVRAVAGGVPDRVGARRTTVAAAAAAAIGLLLVALGPGATGLAGAAVVGAGQALLVPSLGRLALQAVPESQQGLAAGIFFTFTDAGIAVGGVITGLAATAGGPRAALAAGALAVTLVPLAARAREVRLPIALEPSP
jgi:MFS family permease